MVIFSDRGFGDEFQYGTDYETFKAMREQLLGNVRQQLLEQISAIEKLRTEHAVRTKERVEEIVGTSGLSWLDRQRLVRDINVDSRGITRHFADTHAEATKALSALGTGSVKRDYMHAARELVMERTAVAALGADESMIWLDPLIASTPAIRRTRRGDDFHYRIKDREVLVISAEHGFIFREPPGDAMLEASLVAGCSRFGSPLVFDGTPAFVARCAAIAERRGMAYMTQAGAPAAGRSQEDSHSEPQVSGSSNEAPPEPDRKREPSDAPKLSAIGEFLDRLRDEYDAQTTPVAFGTDCGLPIKGTLVHVGPVDSQDSQSPEIVVVLGPKGHLCVMDAKTVAGYHRTEDAITFPSAVGSEVELRAKDGAFTVQMTKAAPSDSPDADQGHRREGRGR